MLLTMRKVAYLLYRILLMSCSFDNENAKLTKYQYEHIRMEAAQRNANIYSLYNNYLSAAKKECYPESIEVIEKGASIDLQSLTVKAYS